ncbi:MAG: hypothetical protein HY518_00205 [Candidatus Aenigmarchaeota archaeon]|nr:hypothetical protein [Candidatus Aenigmarchaeota archaeon]
MAERRLIDYMNHSLSQGHSLVSVRRELTKAGWKAEEIDDAVKTIGTRRQKPVEKVEKKGITSAPAGIIIISAIGILGSISVVLGGILSISLGSLEGVFTTAVGLLGIIAFYLLLKMERTGWILVSIFLALEVISTIFAILTVLSLRSAQGSMILGAGFLLLWAAIFAYLLEKRKLFGIGK